VVKIERFKKGKRCRKNKCFLNLLIIIRRCKHEAIKSVI